MVEKLTDTIGVRVSPELHAVVRGVAESSGLTPGEWVRALIEDALQRERARYLALHSIFGADGAQANDSSVQQG